MMKSGNKLPANKPATKTVIVNLFIFYPLFFYMLNYSNLIRKQRGNIFILNYLIKFVTINQNFLSVNYLIQKYMILKFML